MKTMTKTVLGIAAVFGIALAAVGAAVWSGAYNVAADAPHSQPVYALLETAREHSIAKRAGQLQVPTDLGDSERIRQGAGNYAAMCVTCHLAPGIDGTELSQGLYPAPPNLTREMVGAAEAFWVIKHGIKASGMPAWGESMDDEYIWNMAAFLQKLPGMDKAAYDALVASSDGHSHGGGETGGHSHAEATDDHHGDSGNPSAGHDGTGDSHAHGESGVAKRGSAAEAPSGGETHVHADGETHVHAPRKDPAASESKSDATRQSADPTGTDPPVMEHADDGHDHQH